MTDLLAAPSPTGMTYENLLTTLRQYTERGNASDTTVNYQLPYLINRAERSCADKLKIMGYRYVVTSKMVMGQAVIAKPEGWRNTVSINYGGGPALDQRTTLRARLYEYLRSIYPDDSKMGSPVFYADYSQEAWIVGPTPSRDYPFEALVYRLPDLLSDANQQNYLTQFAPNLLLYECLKALEPFIRNDSRMGLWQNLAAEEIANVNTQDMMKVIDRGQKRTGS